ncbi:hypothetical protein DPMN_157721 [Dreissena polymorpha]|uniref:Ig-like domain-containing protein n=1 Tax=Dreissena polymorpha TaxID=45954 RepID=A0A9D4EL20_DREPO|nr:hypothetical protein DPMN_157721 [Dreissena polymorpha]
MYYGGLSSSVQLSADADGVFVNNLLVMECRTSTPASSVNWLLLKNYSGFENVIVVHEFVNNICLATGGRDTVECFCNSSTVFTCAIKTINVSNDGNRWRCSTPVNGFTTYSNIITINIRITLNTLTFFPRPVAAVSYPIYNTTSAFTCITSQSSPAASIHWFEDGVNITDKSIYHFSSYIATSVIEYSPTTTSIKYLSCVATYTYKNISISLINGTNIQVQYPVSKPAIVMNTTNVSETIHIRENEFFELRCTSTGYPPPSYRWTYPGGNATGNAVELYFDRFSNEHFITCTAINVLFLLNGSTSIKSTSHVISIKMNVSYSPSFKHFVHTDGIFNVSDLRVMKGDNMTLTCEWDANPPAIVLWQGQSNNSSALSVTNIQKDATFTCLAFNFMFEANGSEKQGNATATLSILV